ncbi:hypothetical protein Q8A67_005434 [Cirrhinus molitorella]|uniref:Uncharacterized protein n=1 Tax=Cirrhinus molitorella TaxID=172907 RepID=A0AA88QAN8_9TELE|nr:hypothetical protein Q8A67_005434 [Cirrhinus molitorella]
MRSSVTAMYELYARALGDGAEEMGLDVCGTIDELLSLEEKLKDDTFRKRVFLKHPLSESDSAREEHFAEEDRAVEKPHFTAQTLRSRVKCQSTEATEDPALLRFKGKVKNEEVFKTEEGSCEETHQNVIVMYLQVLECEKNTRLVQMAWRKRLSRSDERRDSHCIPSPPRRR